MKKSLITVLIVYGSSMLAGEPFRLNTDQGNSFFKSEPKLVVAKKKMQANADGESNIVIKMNLTQLAFKNLAFQGEYGFHKKMSFALGFSSLLPTKLNGFFYNTPEEYEGNFTTPILKGWAITPEFRFYPGGKDDKPAPRGFYLAPYFRYAKYSITQDMSYQDRPSDPTYTGVATSVYKGYNAGLMIGQQWIIGKHVSIDWWIIGAGYGKAKYTYEWEADNATLTPAQQAEVKTQLEQSFEEFSLFGLSGSVETTPKSAMMTVVGLPMYSFRFMGLCVGYAF